MYRRRHYLLFLLLLIILIGIVNYFAVTVHLYWSLKGFDKAMHFLGGFWAGFLGLWLFFVRLPSRAGNRRGASSSRKSILLTSFLSALLIGVLWELFELLSQSYALYDTQRFFMFDTLGDLFFDVIGSLLASGVFLFLERDSGSS